MYGERRCIKSRGGLLASTPSPFCQYWWKGNATGFPQWKLHFCRQRTHLCRLFIYLIQGNITFTWPGQHWYTIHRFTGYIICTTEYRGIFALTWFFLYRRVSINSHRHWFFGFSKLQQSGLLNLSQSRILASMIYVQNVLLISRLKS